MISCDKFSGYSYLLPKLFKDWDSARKYLDDHADFFTAINPEIIAIVPLYHNTILDYAAQLQTTKR